MVLAIEDSKFIQRGTQICGFSGSVLYSAVEKVPLLLSAFYRLLCSYVDIRNVIR